MKSGKPLFHHVLCHVPCWKKELPNADRRQGRRNHATGLRPPTQRTRADHRCYPTCSQIHRDQPVADARPDSAQKAQCQDRRLPIHGRTIGARRHDDGYRTSFHTPACDLPPLGAGADRDPGHDRGVPARQPAETIHQHSHWRQFHPCCARGTGRPVPRVRRQIGFGAGRAEDPPAVGLPHRLDSPTADYPGTPQRRDQSHRPGGPRPGRCRCSTWATSLWSDSPRSRGPALFGSRGCSTGRWSSTPRAIP